MFKFKPLAICFATIFLLSSLTAGTLILKNGNRITNIEIVSINDGRVVVEKDKKRKTISIGMIKSYFNTDINGGDSDSLVKLPEYSVSCDVKMPQYGTQKDGDENKCKIDFHVVRKNGESKARYVKFPYFYLWILTTGSLRYGGSRIFFFYYPSQAKVKGKHYDQAAIINVLKNFKRPNYHFDSRGKYNSKSRGSIMGEQRFEIGLKKIRRHKIIAYHLEVWDTEKIIETKDWHDFGARVGKRWWERY